MTVICTTPWNRAATTSACTVPTRAAAPMSSAVLLNCASTMNAVDARTSCTATVISSRNDPIVHSSTTTPSRRASGASSGVPNSQTMKPGQIRSSTAAQPPMPARNARMLAMTAGCRARSRGRK